MLILDDDIPFTDRLFLMCAGLAVTRRTPVRFVFSSTGQTPYRVTRPAIQVLEGMTQFRKLRVEGAELGSSIVEIWPDDLQPEGKINVQLPIASSVSLAVEAYFPLMSAVKNGCKVTVEGGTHTSDNPGFDTIQRSWIPMLDQMGMNLRAELLRPGFAPAGGGRIQLVAEPMSHPEVIEILQAGRQIRNKATLFWAHGSNRDVDKQKEKLANSLRWNASEIELIRNNESLSPGYSVILESTKEDVNNIFEEHSSQRSAHTSATKRVIERFRRFAAQRVPLCRTLAEMLLVPMALAAGGKIRTEPLSPHAEQLLSLLPKLLGVRCEVTHSSLADATITIEQ